jgi:HK97 family phage prohead protease
MALQGRATRYNTITPYHHGAQKLIMPNAFDESMNSGVPIKFMLGQHDGPSIGTTWDALDLFSDLNGLAFRFRFPETAIGNEARAIAAANQNSEMSIGFDYVGARKESRVIDGLPVTVICQAWLYEVSRIAKVSRCRAMGRLSKLSVRTSSSGKRKASMLQF